MKILQMAMNKKNALLQRIEDSTKAAPSDPTAADTATAAMQVDDRSLNDSDMLSGDSRVPESMFDRSVRDIFSACMRRVICGWIVRHTLFCLIHSHSAPIFVTRRCFCTNCAVTVAFIYFGRFYITHTGP